MIQFLRIPQISNATNYRHVIENLKRAHGLPRICLCGKTVSMKLTDFFQDRLIRTKGQVRATTLEDRAKAMKDFIECVGDIDVQDVHYEHGERFIQYCLMQNLTAATTTKKVRQLTRGFQLAEDRGQLDRHPLRKLKPPKAPKRKIRACTWEWHIKDTERRTLPLTAEVVKLLVEHQMSQPMRRKCE